MTFPRTSFPFNQTHRSSWIFAVLITLGVASYVSAADLSAKIEQLPLLPEPVQGDWLVQPTSRSAGVYRTNITNELVLDNGLIRRSFLISPNLACVELRNLQSNQSFLRSIRPECNITIGDQKFDVGGLIGQPVQNFLTPQWYAQLSNDPAAFQLEDFSVQPIQARFPWKPRHQWMANDSVWPPKGIEVQFGFRAPDEATQDAPNLSQLRLVVHYEVYDGIPLICKWMTLENGSEQTIRVKHFTSEIMACVEASSQVEDIAAPLYPNLHVETDFTTCSMHGRSSQVDAVFWLDDPTYQSQVNYKLQSRCLLECRPATGPDIDLPAGETFESFRTWVLAFEDRDETRQGLALGRMYQTIAPWTTENPLIHHVRSSEPEAVRLAIDQSAEVGFELVIMTFGSGFNIENDSPEYLNQIRDLADYAHGKGVSLGGYSLLASRSIGPKDDVVNPATGQPGGFARFGNSPCLESEWGQDYFRKLYNFYEATGCDVLEHDGSYPGDVCASTEHPGHQGLGDSRWKQWETMTKFYRWCRSQGIYLNVPDWYFLNGSNKTGMGYRETNWSLPRDYQEIIERQNIFDGTRYKLPTMGWMFVPLTQYHGGGAAATIEPLNEHLDHYERRLQNLLGAGVQACFRGPRLYDTDQTKAMVRHWVDFYKQNRAILDSSLIPLRRADGRDWDGWLHVNPRLETPAMAMLYNPLDQEITRQIRVPLYYSGISESAEVQLQDSPKRSVTLNRREQAELSVDLPARGAVWIRFSQNPLSSSAESN